MRPSARIFTSFVALALFAWLMPLGAFIDSSQEKTACGGNRAFHMCTCEMGSFQASKGPGPQKISFTSASGVEKTNKSAGGSSENGFTGGSGMAKVRVITFQLPELQLVFPRQISLLALDPVPKF